MKMRVNMFICSFVCVHVGSLNLCRNPISCRIPLYVGFDTMCVYVRLPENVFFVFMECNKTAWSAASNRRDTAAPGKDTSYFLWHGCNFLSPSFLWTLSQSLGWLAGLCVCEWGLSIASSFDSSALTSCLPRLRLRSYLPPLREETESSVSVRFYHNEDQMSDEDGKMWGMRAFGQKCAQGWLRPKHGFRVMITSGSGLCKAFYEIMENPVSSVYSVKHVQYVYK